MFIEKRNIIWLILLTLTTSMVFGQQGFFVPRSGKVFFTGDSATIFSNVINSGNLGVGKNAVLNFTGAVWENEPGSLITDEAYETTGISGIGGWIRFISDSLRQQLTGGYNAANKTGAAFYRLQVQNKNGIELQNGNTKIRKEIKLSDGLVYLKDNLLAIGDNHPGEITGYDSAHYFVTGSTPGSGILLREGINMASGRVDFPVGSREHAYTPASILSKSVVADDFYVNVFDSVRSDVFSGNNLSAIGVNKTWAVGKSFRPNMDDAEIYLQHLNQDEGAVFTANKRNTYIARYDGTKWDTGSPQYFPLPGSITSGNGLMNSGVNHRLFVNEISGPSYFTKFTGNGDPAFTTQWWFNAYILDEKRIYTYWKTNPEVYVHYFVVQRKLAGETTFSDIDTVSSRAINGLSFVEQDYSSTDFNNYTGVMYYRLKRVDYGNAVAYSDIVTLERKPKSFDNLVWPNPAKEKFNISIGNVVPTYMIIITDVQGHAVRRIKVNMPANGRNTIEVDGLIPGTYFVTFMKYDGEIIETRKVIVLGD
jgi:hypothetical protein